MKINATKLFLAIVGGTPLALQIAYMSQINGHITVSGFTLQLIRSWSDGVRIVYNYTLEPIIIFAASHVRLNLIINEERRQISALINSLAIPIIYDIIRRQPKLLGDKNRSFYELFSLIALTSLLLISSAFPFISKNPLDSYFVLSFVFVVPLLGLISVTMVSALSFFDKEYFVFLWSDIKPLISSLKYYKSMASAFLLLAAYGTIDYFVLRSIGL